MKSERDTSSVVIVSDDSISDLRYDCSHILLNTNNLLHVVFMSHLHPEYSDGDNIKDTTSSDDSADEAQCPPEK